MIYACSKCCRVSRACLLEETRPVVVFDCFTPLVPARLTHDGATDFCSAALSAADYSIRDENHRVLYLVAMRLRGLSPSQHPSRCTYSYRNELELRFGVGRLVKTYEDFFEIVSFLYKAMRMF